ncbi:thioesterase superfamily member 4 [Fusarium heterosporum]|uniref:Thioesterase superfamily member 4 n=1 Tax=Fusarium heterosporum TaxID=42747 RepID=A0A8H5SS10_FUSHE|nr:thioesterase superfamily member 4 [Fusarium heterosporum]
MLASKLFRPRPRTPTPLPSFWIPSPAPLYRLRDRIGFSVNTNLSLSSIDTFSSASMSFPPFINSIICPALELVPKNAPPDLFASELSFFASHPWTATLLSAPDAIPFLPSCRNPRSSAHDQLFGNTLNNTRGLNHFISFFHAPSHEVAQDPSHNITEIVVLVSVGEGVSGYPGLVHGGVIATLLDESMGTIFDLNGTLGKDARAFKTSSVTGGINVKYLKPVYTDSVLRIKAVAEEIDGRKTRVRGEMMNEKGEVLATCTSQWVALKPSL